MIKLKSIIQEIRADRQQKEWISHGETMDRGGDIGKLQAVPGGMNDQNPNFGGDNGNKNDDVEDWDGIKEHKDYFCYIGGNDWHNHIAEAVCYINEEGQPPSKLKIKIKTHGLRKTNDRNSDLSERVKKHCKKIVGKWMSGAKKYRDNPSNINEVGNPTLPSWKQCFENSKKDLLQIQSCIVGEDESASVDCVNFSYHK